MVYSEKLGQEYEIESKYYQHGNYMEYIAIKRETGERVLIRVFNQPKMQIQNTLRKLNNMSHSGLIQILDVIVESDVIYIVTKMRTGIPLLEFLLSIRTKSF